MKYFTDENNNKIELNAVFPNWWNEFALCYDTEGNEYIVLVSEINEDAE